MLFGSSGWSVGDLARPTQCFHDGDVYEVDWRNMRVLFGEPMRKRRGMSRNWECSRYCTVLVQYGPEAKNSSMRWDTFLKLRLVRAKMLIGRLKRETATPQAEPQADGEMNRKCKGPQSLATRAAWPAKHY